MYTSMTLYKSTSPLIKRPIATTSPPKDEKGINIDISMVEGADILIFTGIIVLMVSSFVSNTDKG